MVLTLKQLNLVLIINELFAPSLEICTHYVMIKIKLKWCHAIITVSRFSLDTKINASLFFIRINIFQSSRKLILNLSRFQPRNIRHTKLKHGRKFYPWEPPWKCRKLRKGPHFRILGVIGKSIINLGRIRFLLEAR